MERRRASLDSINGLVDGLHRGGCPLLAEWQERLHYHFSSLSDRRGEEGLAVFALEHGLDERERAKLVQDVRRSLEHGYIDHRAPLAWLVYATERGYHYEGGEYWQTFAENTPKWLERGDREFIRKIFWQFHQRYSGFRPSGRWANHFGIISWPISHAILPTDLQRRLAVCLADLLGRIIDRDVIENPELLGQYIEAHAGQASSRFHNLAQEHALLGRISQALLRDEASEGLLLDSTRQRILADLRKTRTAANALGRARDHHARLIAIRGLGGGNVGSRAEGPGGPAPSQRVRPPRLLLVPGAERAWRLMVQVPRLVHLAALEPSWERALSDTRLRIRGSRRRIPRGGLLHSDVLETLSTLPAPGPLLHEDPSLPDGLASSLETLLSIRAGDDWLFARRADGSCVELEGRVVRPDREYLILRRTPPPACPPGVKEAEIACRYAWLGELSTDELGSADNAGLAVLGLSIGEALHLRPVGPPVCDWDTHGAVEVLTTDRPCFALSTNALDQRFRLSVAGTQLAPLMVSAEAAPEIFFSIPALPVGQHRLLVETDRGGWRSLGEVAISVREPRQWSTGQGRGGLLRIETSPPHATLEQLWSGAGTLTVHGPLGARVRGEVTLSDHDDTGSPVGGGVFPLGEVTLPLQPTDWRALFSTKVEGTGRGAAAYDRSEEILIEFGAEGVGNADVTLSRSFTPLRWRVRRTGQGPFILRLSDESDQTEHLRVLYASFSTPEAGEELDSHDFDDDWEVESSGGLFTARRGECIRSIVVPPRVQNLLDLRVAPSVRAEGGGEEEAHLLLKIAETWAGADCPYRSVASALVRRVMLALARALAEMACRPRWASVEGAFAETISSRDPWRPYNIARRGFSPADAERVLWRKFMDKVLLTLDDPLSAHVQLVVDTRRDLRFRRKVVTDMVVVSSSHLAPRQVSLEEFAEFAIRCFLWPGTVLGKYAQPDLDARLSCFLKDEFTATLARGVALALEREGVTIADDY